MFQRIYKKYSVRQLFTYTGVSTWRIIRQMIKLTFARLFGKRYVIAPVNDYIMKLDLDMPGLSKVLYVYGKRELPDTQVMQDVLQPGMGVADIGANIGYYTLLAARQVGETGHVYAFEPDPRNVPLLQENVVLNQMKDRVTVIPQAVADQSGTQELHLDERTNVSSFTDRRNTVDTVPVECVSLRDFSHMDDIDILRMDAEGYECKIIDGVLPYLAEHNRPFSIMLEVHTEAYDNDEFNFDRILERLFALGFATTHVIANSGHIAAYREKGYAVAGEWTETKHTRALFCNITPEDTYTFIAERRVRAMLLARG